jgi:5-methylcytosine-specific restriction endonuclease McrA
MKKKKRKYNLKSRITSALRRVWYYSPMRNECKKRAKSGVCELCEVKRDKLQVDHVISVVGSEGFLNWDLYIKRLFVESDGLQNICETCHKHKTQSDRIARKQNKK